MIAAHQSAIRTAVSRLYVDATLTLPGSRTRDGRGGYTSGASGPIAVKAQRENRAETLQANNVEPHQAMIYVIADTVPEGARIGLQGETWRVTRTVTDPVNVAPACICERQA